MREKICREAGRGEKQLENPDKVACLAAVLLHGFLSLLLSLPSDAPEVHSCYFLRVTHCLNKSKDLFSIYLLLALRRSLFFQIAPSIWITKKTHLESVYSVNDLSLTDSNAQVGAIISDF
jgi:hypothetical protein